MVLSVWQWGGANTKTGHACVQFDDDYGKKYIERHVGLVGGLTRNDTWANTTCRDQGYGINYKNIGMPQQHNGVNFQPFD